LCDTDNVLSAAAVLRLVRALLAVEAEDTPADLTPTDPKGGKADLIPLHPVTTLVNDTQVTGAINPVAPAGEKRRRVRFGTSF
jgi:hypothetical protein